MIEIIKKVVTTQEIFLNLQSQENITFFLRLFFNKTHAQHIPEFL